uniref:Uncharacterized protein n=1 Tax=Trichinella nativa TaxID=6335 RepID=A0A0V1JNU3_9BILA
MYTVGPGIWLEKTWNMARKLTNEENENLTW